VFASGMAYSDEAHIYFLNWHYQYRSAPREEDVRNRHHIYVHIYDGGEIRRIKYLLTENLEEMNYPVYPVYPGAYMVIDIIDRNGEVETYLLNQFGFWKKGTDKLFKLPEAFRDKYTFFTDLMRIKYSW
jgi:hypothetical protein